MTGIISTSFRSSGIRSDRSSHDPLACLELAGPDQDRPHRAPPDHGHAGSPHRRRGPRAGRLQRRGVSRHDPSGGQAGADAGVAGPLRRLGEIRVAVVGHRTAILAARIAARAFARASSGSRSFSSSITSASELIALRIATFSVSRATFMRSNRSARLPAALVTRSAAVALDSPRREIIWTTAVPIDPNAAPTPPVTSAFTSPLVVLTDLRRS